MAMFPKYGLKQGDGVLVSLVDEYWKPLPFLNFEAVSEPDSHSITFVPTKPQTEWDVAIPVKAGQVPDWFFPHDSSRFTVGTDDEQTFECRFIKQGNPPGLHFTREVRQAQAYFRKRLMLSSSARVTTDNFAKYGTYSFLMFRLDETIYFLDFSPDVESDANRSLLQPRREVIHTTESPQYASKRAQKEARQRGLPVYPGRLSASEPLPYLPYNSGEIVVIRQQEKGSGSVYEVALEGPPK